MRFIIFLLLLLPLMGSGQDKLQEKGDELYSVNRYAEALEIYQTLEATTSDSNKKYPLLLQIGSCFTNLHNPKKALNYYSAAYAFDSSFNSDQFYDFINALIENGKYSKARNLLANGDGESFIETTLIKKCNYALKNSEVDKNILIKPLFKEQNIKTYGISIYKNELLYITREKNLKDKSESYSRLNYDSKNDAYLNRLFSAELPMNASYPSIDEKNQIAYFSGNASDLKKYTDSKREKQKIGIGGVNNLFIWSINMNSRSPDPEYLSFNHVDFSCTHPCISKNGDTLYFASNMLGGFGGYDIFYVTKSGDTWSSPENMGREVNTFLNEGYPQISKGTLYFSSNGHPGYGGQDIFRYNSETNKVQNLGKPINSSYDDFSYNQFNSSKGFLISNRDNEFGMDIIYRFIRLANDQQKKTSFAAKKEKKPVLSVNVKNFLNNEAIEKVEIEFSETNRGSVIKITDTNGNSGFSLADGKYKLTILHDGFVPENRNITIENSKRSILTILLKPELSKNKPLIIRSIEFDFDRSQIKPSSIPVIDQLAVLLKKQSDARFRVGVHMDSRGAEIYNTIVSESIAKAIMQKLTERGVPADHLIAVGYGESKLLNHCSSGVDCTEEEHSVNKRLEISIIE